MATEISLRRLPIDAVLTRARVRAPSWTAPAWGAIATTTLFVAITCWWLSIDRSIPVFDAGLHLHLVQDVYSALRAGHLGTAFTISKPYPPFTYLIGALGLAVGGIAVAPPILAENLVFVPLLALGCYQIGKRAFGPPAGLLAVGFALGSPLVIAQFHVFMVDAPETAMAAVSIWLIIASEGFSRVGMSALAGLAVGLGLLTKEPLIFYVAGILAVAAVRAVLAFLDEGEVRWRGVLAFSAVLLAIALPWYIDQYSTVNGLVTQGVNTANEHYTRDIAPARYSLDNFTWYIWNFINFQLWAPLFAFAATGWIWMIARLARRQPVSDIAPELLVGAFVAWLAITETFVHDTRYSEPMLTYLAVIGTGWIVWLGRTARIAAIAVLVTIAVANTLGTSFGLGGDLKVTLPGSQAVTLQQRDSINFFANGGFLVGKPERDGDILASFRAMHRAGVRQIDLNEKFLFESDFSTAGLLALAQIAGISSIEGVPLAKLSVRDAVFAHGRISPRSGPPCIRLSDGTGVWIRLGNAQAPGSRDYCPSHHPPFYGPPQQAKRAPHQHA